MNRLFKMILVLSIVFSSSWISLKAEENVDLKQVPDYSADFGDYGLTISSSDQDFLDAIYQIQLIETSSGKEYDVVFTSEHWEVTNQSLFISCEKYWETGVLPKTAPKLIINVYGYEQTSDSVYVDSSKEKDVTLSVDESGNIVIESSNEHWLRSLVESPNDSAIKMDTNYSYSRYINNADLIYQDGKILITPSVQIKYQLMTGKTYTLQASDISDYYVSFVLGSVQITNGFRKFPDDISLSVNEYGQLFISSEDKAWLESVLEYKQVTGGSSVEFYKDVDEEKYQFFNDEHQTDIHYVDGNLVINAETLDERGLISNGYYYCDIYAYGYEKYHESYTISNFGKLPPDDITISTDDSGNLIIFSENLEWLQGLRTGSTSQKGSVIHVYENGEEVSYIPYTFLDNQSDRMVVTPKSQKRLSLTNGINYTFRIKAKDYVMTEISDIVLTHALIDVRNDVNIEVEEDGSIRIESSNEAWLDELVSKDKTGTVMFLDDGGKIDTSISNYNRSEPLLVMKEGCVYISPKTLWQERVMNDTTYELAIRTDDYTTVRKTITITNGLRINPDDVTLKKVNGDIIISSSNEHYLQSFLLDGTTMTLNWRPIENTGLRIEEGHLIIPLQTLRTSGLADGTYVFIFTPAGYTETRKTINYSKYSSLPEDIVVGTDEVSGNIYIESQDKVWLKGLVSSEERDVNIHVYDGNGEKWSCLLNYESHIDLVMAGDHRVIISPEVQADAGLYTNETYYLELHSVGFDEDTSRYEVTIVDGAETVPSSDLSIGIDEDTGDFVVICRDREYASKLKDGEIKFLYGSLGTGYIGKKDGFLRRGDKFIILFDRLNKSNLKQSELFTVVLIAEGYDDVYFYNFEMTHLSDDGRMQVRVIQDNDGNLVVSSSDPQWITDLLNSAANHVWLINDELEFRTTIRSTQMREENGNVVIPVEALQEAGVSDSPAWRGVFYVDDYPAVNFNVAIYNSLKEVPEMEWSIDNQQGIVIQTSDVDYLNAVNEIKFTGTLSSDFELSSESWEVSENRLVIPWSVLVENRIYLGTNNVVIYAEGYGPYRKLISLSDEVPSDVLVTVEETTGNLMIESNDLLWLNYLYHGSIELMDNDTGIIWAFDKSVMTLNESSLILSSDIFIEKGLSVGEYSGKLKPLNYEEHLFTVSLSTANQKYPEDLVVEFDEVSGLTVSSENTDYISKVSKITLRNEMISYEFDGNELLIDSNSTTLSVDVVLQSGIGSGKYDVVIEVDGYGLFQKEMLISGEEFDANAVVIRLSGTTRYETSLKIANQLKEAKGVDKFDTVILASGRNFADALAGSYLAAKKNAPILMVDPLKNNTEQILTYLESNLSTDGKVYILGGEAAVPLFVEEALTGYNVTRLKGTDRYGTNLAILAEAGVESEPVLVCNAKNFADSLSASALGKPILLVGNTLRPEQKMFLENHQVDMIYVLGGTSAVNEAVENDLKAHGTIERISGKTRYETSVLIAEKLLGDVDSVIFAYARNYPDGLCGGALAYALNAPLILVDTDKNDAHDDMAIEYVRSQYLRKGIVLGGSNLVKDDTVRQALSMDSESVIIMK